MGRKCTKQKEAAARARKSRYHQQEGSDQLSSPSSTDLANTIAGAPSANQSPVLSWDSAAFDNDEECHWDGRISHIPSDSDSDSEFTWSTGSDTEEEFSELEGDELVGSLQKQLEAEIKMLRQPTPYELITKSRTAKEWVKAESNRSLGYNGLSERTKRRNDQQARAKEKVDAVTRKRCAPLQNYQNDLVLINFQ